MSDTTTFKLDDSSIALIAKNLQIALLTGTDIVDHLRMMDLTTNTSGKLVPTDNYNVLFEKNLQVMLAQLEKLQQESTNEGDNSFDV